MVKIDMSCVLFVLIWVRVFVIMKGHCIARCDVIKPI